MSFNNDTLNMMSWVDGGRAQEMAPHTQMSPDLTTLNEPKSKAVATDKLLNYMIVSTSGELKNPGIL